MLKNLHAPITVLAIDDDADVRSTIGRALKQEGHAVIEAENAEVALRLVQDHHPDLIILDISLGGMNGYELCSQLRSMPFVDQTPILFLSVHQNAQSIAHALDIGGDDYLRKPFAARELNARVRALLRRSASKQNFGLVTLHLEPETSAVVIDNKRIVLTPTEFNLLNYLCQGGDDYHTPADLLENLWHYAPGTGDTALVRNHVRNLRRKLEADPDHPAIIISLHGRGYGVNARIE
jgi:DNA-binding response OmpR family regulator